MLDAAPSSETSPMPHSIELEQALLGAILVDNAAALRVLGVVTASDFFDGVHAEIFATALEFIRENRVANAFTLKGHFAGRDIIEGLTVPQYLGRLATAATTTANARDYARGIVEYANRRRLCAMAAQVNEAARMPSVGLSEAVGAAVSVLDDVMARARPDKVSRASLGESMRDLMDSIANDDGADRISSGLTSLDAVTGGWRRKQFAILAGRPGMGKSAVATSSMIRTAKTGAGVLMFSLEMSREALACRCLSDLSWHPSNRIPYSTALAGRLSSSDIDAWAKSTLAYDKLPITIDDARGLTIAELGSRIRSEAQRMDRKGISLGLVIVDHLGLVKPSGRYSGNKVQETGEVSDALCTLAKEHNVAMLALHQLNRGTEGRDNKRPTLADLRNSGDLEQDADLVCFAFREAYYLERMKYDAGSQQEMQRQTELEACRNTLEIMVAKNRNGATPTVPMYCDMACNVVRDLARDDVPPSRKMAAAGDA